MSNQFTWDEKTKIAFVDFLRVQHIDMPIFDVIEAFKAASHTPAPEPLKPSPLFTTEDGKDVFPGEIYYSVFIEEGFGFLLWNPYKWQASSETHIRGRKVFSTEKAANEYILMNKPCLSVNDVWDYFKCFIHPGDKDKVFQGLREKAKSKQSNNK